MTTTQTEKITITRKEAARKLGIAVPTLDRLVKKHQLPHLRIGRRVMFTKQLLDNYIAKVTQVGK